MFTSIELQVRDKLHITINQYIIYGTGKRFPIFFNSFYHYGIPGFTWQEGGFSFFIHLNKDFD